MSFSYFLFSLSLIPLSLLSLSSYSFLYLHPSLTPFFTSTLLVLLSLFTLLVPLSLLTPPLGPYPASFKTSHNPAEIKEKEKEKEKEEKEKKRKRTYQTGEIHWSSSTSWAAILKHAQFLHVNVAGKDSSDLDLIQQIATDLNLTYKDKINFNFNRTIDRGAYDKKNKEEKRGKVLF